MFYLNDIHLFKYLMLRLFSKSLTQKFCLNNRLNRIYDITFQVKDVTMIKGLSTQTPFVEIEENKIQFPQNEMILHLNQRFLQEDRLKFLDSDLNEYHPTTPLQVICSQPFYLKQRNNLYLIMNNVPIVFLHKNPVFEATQCSRVVESMCKGALIDLPENEKQVLSGPAVHNLLITNLLKQGMLHKINKIRMKQVLKIVNREINKFEQEIRQVEYHFKRKANKKLKWFTGFLFLQYVGMHYYIYHHLSWDVMQPVTVIFANIDLFVGYFFFVLSGRDWTYGEIHGSFFDAAKTKKLKKYGIKVQKYEELLKIRKYLELRVSLLSKNTNQIKQFLQEPIQILDTR